MTMWLKNRQPDIRHVFAAFSQKRGIAAPQTYPQNMWIRTLVLFKQWVSATFCGEFQDCAASSSTPLPTEVNR
jgi:hypothetical protein